MKIDTLRSLWVDHSFPSELFDINGFKNWLSRDDFEISSVHDQHSFELYVKSPDLIKSAFSVESIRFSLNSLQSVHMVRSSPDFPKINSWHLIQIYYAAFFAAHSILRRFGRPFTQLETGHSKHLSERARLECAPESKDFVAGPFATEYNPNQRIILLKSGGESHKGLWSAYTALIKTLSIDVLRARTGTIEREKASQELTALVDSLTANNSLNSGNWLSKIRNEVNYQSPEEFWFPFSKNASLSANIFSKFRKWKTIDLNESDFRLSKTNVERFFGTSLFIVQMAHALSMDYLQIAPPRCRSKQCYQKFLGLTDGRFEA